MVIIRESDYSGKVIASKSSHERRELMGHYICRFNAKADSINWDFINQELYGNFINCDLPSDFD